MKKILFLICNIRPSLFILLLASCSKPSLLNNEGVLDMYFEKYRSSKDAFVESLVLSPESLHTRYNLSLVDLKEERIASADKELDHLLKLLRNSQSFDKKNEELFKVLFAKAIIQTSLENIPGALTRYQEALGLKPDSISVKNNIELLLKNQSGKSGSDGEKSDKKGKKGDSKKEKDKDQDGGDSKDKKGEGDNPSDETPKGRDDSTLKRKNLSEKEKDQILKEIKSQESKIRSKENSNKKKGEGVSGKAW